MKIKHSSFYMAVTAVLLLAGTVSLARIVETMTVTAQKDPAFTLSFHDNLFDLSARDAEIQDVLRAIGEAGGIQLKIDQALQGKVTVDLKGASLKNLLNALVRSGSMVFEEKNGGYEMVSATVTSQQQGEEPAPAVPAVPMSDEERENLKARGILSNSGQSIKSLMRKGQSAIILQNAVIDVAEIGRTGKNVEIPEELQAPEDTEYHIVQFDHPATDADKAALEAAGAALSHYVPYHAYAVHVPAGSMNAVRRIPGVQHVEPYHPYYKMSKDILAYATGLEAAGDVERLSGGQFNVMLFRGAELPAELKSADVEIVSTSETAGRRLVTVKCPTDKLMELVKADALQWIEPDMPRMPMNDLAARRIRANSLKTLHPTLTGEGVIVNVTDTGIDFLNPGFAMDALLPTTTGLNSRIHYYGYKTGGLTSDGMPGDNNGHGTHVSGSILGNGALSATANKVPGSGSAPYGPYQFAGMAPGAKVVMLEDFNSFTFAEQTKTSYNKGARISNNSWGNTLFEYGTSSAAWDELVRDADPDAMGNQEYIVFFAAGNAGSGNDDGTGGNAQTVGEPGNAKNVITVGAVEQARRADNIMNVGYGGSIIRSEDETDSDWQVSSFSSRGPVTATDLRVKPDIMAPGSYVMSIQSHETMPDDYQYSGDVNMDYRYGNVDSGTNFALFSGTSMATPVAAGGAALIYQYCTNVLGRIPSPALMKAMLVNGARMLNSMVYKHPVYVGDLTTVDQGWGMLDITRSVDGTMVFDSSEVEVLDQADTTALNTGAEYSKQIKLTGREGGLKITLAWTDAAGTPGNGVQLVNDLDLYVMAPGGGGYQGNLFDPDGVHSYKLPELHSAYSDPYNNVETVVIPSGLAGTYTIKVVGYGVPAGPQDFALVIMKGIGIEGRSEGNNPDICMSADDRPVVAYSYDASIDGSFSNLDRQVYVKKWMGDVGDVSDLGDWRRLDDQWYEVRGSASGTGISRTMENSEDPAVAVDGERIFVAWQEYPQNQVPGNYSHIFFKMYDGTNWVELGNSARGEGVSLNTMHEVSEPMVGVAWDGQPMVAWRQAGDNPNLSRVMLAKWNGTAWAGLAGSNSNGIPSPAATKIATNVSMVVNNSGYPVVAWKEATNPDGIVVQRWSGAAWTAMNVPDSSPYIDYPRLGKDVNGNLYITWVQTYGNPPGAYSTYQVYAMRSSGGAWSAVGGSTTFPGISAATNVSLRPFSPAIQGSFNGNIVVTWQAGETNNAIMVKEWVARQSVWTNVGDSAVWPGIAPVGGVSAVPRLAVSSAGVPYVAFRNLSEAIGSTEIMTYSYVTDSTPPVFDGLQRAVGGTNGTVTLSWLPAVDNLPTTIVYYIYRSTQTWACGSTPDCDPDDVFSNRIAVITNATTHVVSGLTPNMVWCFGVRAVDQRDLVDDNTSTRSAGPVTGAGDNDGDCLLNALELTIGTEPCIPDTDGDGMDDGWEWTWSPLNGNAGGVDPLDNGTDNVGTLAPGDGDADQLPYADIDDDGATNLEEYEWWLSNIHTGASCTGYFSPTNSPNPADPDTDGDGMLDGWEMVNGLNPVDPGDDGGDLDGDGLSNLEEFQNNTDPNAADSDGDGLTDGDEVNNRLTDPTLADTDLDGLDDGYEVGIGTEPTDADSNGNYLSDGDMYQLGWDPSVPMDVYNVWLEETFETSTWNNWVHHAPNAYMPIDLWHLSQAEPATDLSNITYMDNRSTNTAYRFADDVHLGTNTAADYNKGMALRAALESWQFDPLTASNLYIQWTEYFETEPDRDYMQVLARGSENPNWLVVSTAVSGRSGVPQDGSEPARWVRRRADLSRFIGSSNVQVRFLFTAENSVNNDYPGWYVDDVLIYEGTTIRGWVRNENGAPLAGAVVQAIGRGGVNEYIDGHRYINPGKIFAEVKTAEDGSYVMSGLPQGRYYVKASFPNYKSEFFDGPLVAGAYGFGSLDNPGVYDISSVEPSRGWIDLTAAGSSEECDFELEKGSSRSYLGVMMAGQTQDVWVNGLTNALKARIWDGVASTNKLADDFDDYQTWAAGTPTNNHPDWLNNPVKPNLLGDLAPGDHILYIGDGLGMVSAPAVTLRQGEVTLVDVQTNQPLGHAYVSTAGGSGMEIVIDGRATGIQTPGVVTLPAGLHYIGLESGSGFKTGYKKISVPLAGRVSVVFSSEEVTRSNAGAELRAVDVNANPLAGVSYYLDGQLAATAATNETSVIISGLAEGLHFVSAGKVGYRIAPARILSSSSGITNGVLFVLSEADEDYDGVGDFTETDGYTNIYLYHRNDDPDADGLSNAQEYELFRRFNIRLNIFDADTDDDGMSDGEEVGYDGVADRLARSVTETNVQEWTETVRVLFEGSYLTGIDNFGSGAVAPAVECDRFEASQFTHPVLAVPAIEQAVTLFGGIPAAGLSQAVSLGHPDASVILADTMPDSVDTDGDGMWDGFEFQYEFMNAARILDPIECGALDDDPDNDGLTNYEEFLGPDRVANTNDWTDPATSDTDGDSMPDGWEYTYGLDPNDPSDAMLDPDGDGLTNLGEYFAGSNPNLADSDMDGLPDFQEVVIYGTDPNDPDTDKDGLLDGREVWDADLDGVRDGGVFPFWNGGDLDGDGLIDGPTDWDTDGDGMPDGFEALDLYGNLRDDPRLDPFNPFDGDEDPDGDGLSNLQEYLVRDALFGNHPGDFSGFSVLWANSVFPTWDYSTDPFNADSDGDGMPDGFEVLNGLHPMDPVGIDNFQLIRYPELYTEGDLDSDGLWNILEYSIRFALDADADPNDVVSLSTHPWNPDTDGDGLVDGEEHHALRSHPVLQDTDGDRLPDGNLDPDRVGEVSSALKTNDYMIICDTNGITWLDAVSNAMTMAHPSNPELLGHIVSIRDAQENAQIMDYLTASGVTDAAIGGYIARITVNEVDADTGDILNTWVITNSGWISGGIMTYENYAAGYEPLVSEGTNYSPYMIGPGGTWYTIHPTQTIQCYVVEWEEVGNADNHFDSATNDLWRLVYPATDTHRRPYWERVEIDPASAIPPPRWAAGSVYVPGFERKNCEFGNHGERFDSQIILDNRKMVIIGGREGVDKYSDVWEYWIQSNSWTRSESDLSLAGGLSTKTPGMDEGLSEFGAVTMMGYSQTGCDDCFEVPWDCEGECFAEPKHRPWNNGYQKSSVDMTFIHGGWGDNNHYYSEEPMPSIYYKSTDDRQPVVDTLTTDEDVAEALETTITQEGTNTTVESEFVAVESVKLPGESRLVLPVGVWTEIDTEETAGDTSTVTRAYNGYTAIHFSDMNISLDCETILQVALEIDVVRPPEVADLTFDLFGEVNDDGKSSSEYGETDGLPSRRTPNTSLLPVTIVTGFTGVLSVDITDIFNELMQVKGHAENTIGFILDASSASEAAFIKDAGTKLVVTYMPMYKVPAEWVAGGTVQLCPEVPSRRKSHGMVYDYPRDRVVLFGGMNGRMVFDETWEGTPVWARRDGTENMLSPRRVAWVKIPTAIAPPARWGHSMVYDDANERTLVFGGFDKNNQPLNDLWAFYGSRDVEVISTNSADTNAVSAVETSTVTTAAAWVKITDFKDSQRPSPRGGAMMIFHGGAFYDRGFADYTYGRRNKVVLFGGTDGEKYYNDLWVYDENFSDPCLDSCGDAKSRWILVDPGGEHGQGPSPRAFGSFVFAQNGALSPDAEGLGTYGKDPVGRKRSAKSCGYLFGGRTGTLPTSKDTDQDMVDDGTEYELGGPAAGRDPRVNALVQKDMGEMMPFAFNRIGTDMGGYPNPLRGAIANLEALSFPDRVHAFRMGSLFTTQFLPYQGFPLETCMDYMHAQISDNWIDQPYDDPHTNQLVWIIGVDAPFPDWTNLWYHRAGFEDPDDPMDVWALGVPNNSSLGPIAAPPYAHSGRWCYGTGLTGPYPNDAVMELYSPIVNLNVPAVNGTSTNNMNSYFLVFYEWLHLADSNDYVKIDAVRPETDADVRTRKPGLNKPVITVLGRRSNSSNTRGSWRKVVVPLDSLGGEPQVYFRFVLQSDSKNTSGGWYIDDIAILQGAELYGNYGSMAGEEVELLGENYNNNVQAVTQTGEGGYFEFGLLPTGNYMIDGVPAAITPDAAVVEIAVLMFDGIGPAAGGREISWMTETGWTYWLEYTTDFVTWNPLHTEGPVVVPGVFTFTDPSGDPLRAYRILGSPPP